MAKDLKIPIEIARSRDLNANSKMALSELLSTADYKMPANLSFVAIGDAIGITELAAKNAIVDLAGAGMVTLLSPQDEPEVSIAEATTARVWLEMRVELRRSPVNADGQQELPLDTALQFADGALAAIDGITFERSVTPDVEIPGAVFLNVWRLDDKGERVQHVVQGVMFDSEDEAEQWWSEFSEGAEVNILSWLVTLPLTDSDASGNFFVCLTSDTFAMVIAELKAQCEAIPDEAVRNEALDQLEKCEVDEDVCLHGRHYYSDDNDDRAMSFETEEVEHFTEGDPPAETSEAAAEAAGETEPVEETAGEKAIEPESEEPAEAEVEEPAAEEPAAEEPAEESGETERSECPVTAEQWAMPGFVESLNFCATNPKVTTVKIRNLPSKVSGDQADAICAALLSLGVLDSADTGPWKVVLDSTTVRTWLTFAPA
jgi:hypothetical protein